jgi:hypothetical protein
VQEDGADGTRIEDEPATLLPLLGKSVREARENSQITINAQMGGKKEVVTMQQKLTKRIYNSYGWVVTARPPGLPDIFYNPQSDTHILLHDEGGVHYVSISHKQHRGLLKGAPQRISPYYIHNSAKPTAHQREHMITGHWERGGAHEARIYALTYMSHHPAGRH